MIQPAVLLPKIHYQGNVLVGKKYFPQAFLEWINFGPEPGPEGCMSQQFALAQSTQDRLQTLALTIEQLVVTAHSTGRQRDPIALSGCVAEIAATLSDCAITAPLDGGSYCWLSEAEKKPLSIWISQRIWRMAGPLKNGRSPESLARLSFFPVEEVKSSVKVIAERLDLEDPVEIGMSNFDYHALAVKGYPSADRIFRIHLNQRVGHDGCVMKIADGQIAKFVVAFYTSPSFCVRLGGLEDDRHDHSYTSVEKFIEESVLNGIQQEEGVVENLGHIPPLFKSNSFQPKGSLVGVSVGNLAKEFGLSPKRVIETARMLNIEASNASYILKPGQADRIRAKIGTGFF